MSTPISTVNGVASGIQWQTMVDQIIALESTRSVTPLQTKQAALSGAAAAWTEFQTVVGKFRDAAQALRDATAFAGLSASATPSATSGKNLLSATAASTATSGTYSIDVEQLASAEKLGGGVFSAATVALPDLSGSFSLNSRTIAVAATDTLNSVRDKINALNSGASATGVTASVLRTNTGARLVLSADNTGSTGIELVDGGSGALTVLGLTDSTVTSNISTGGATQTFRLSSSTAAFASLFGIPLPTPSTIMVGGQTITVDFSIDSLATIAAKINAATSSTNAATVVTETAGGRTYSRLQTTLAVEALTAPQPNPTESELTAAANSARTLAVLGFTTAGRGAIAQVVKSANTFTDAGNASANAIGATKLSDLLVGGQSLGIGAGDKVTISGKRGDGTSFTTSLDVGSNTAISDLIASAASGFATGRSANVVIDNGRLVVTDNTKGDSQLSVSMTVAKSSGTTISLGIFGTTNGGSVGLTRQIMTGSDAQFFVDGQSVTRSSNTVSDVLTGVTLNLLAAESGSTVALTVARNYSDVTTKMQTFASTYNDVRTWANTNTATGKRLANSSTVRSMVNSLSTALLTTVKGLTGAYTTPSLVGLSRDETGILSLDTTVFQAALALNFSDVQKLFSRSAVPSDPEVSFVNATDATQATSTPYAVVITQAATAGNWTGSPFNTYATTGTADAMTVSDAATGYSGSIALADATPIDTVVANLNTMFATQKMRLQAAKSAGALKISSLDYGAAAGFTVTYTPGSVDGTAQLGIPAGHYAGTNVTGSIGGVDATGRGQILTGATGSPSAGLSLRYTGSAARDAGSVAFSVGIGGMLHSIADSIARDLDGQALTLSANATSQASALDARITAAQDRLATHKASLTAQFIAMESAMSKAQSVGGSLTSQINSLFTYNKVQ